MRRWEGGSFASADTGLIGRELGLSKNTVADIVRRSRPVPTPQEGNAAEPCGGDEAPAPHEVPISFLK